MAHTVPFRALAAHRPCGSFNSNRGAMPHNLRTQS